jgi:hypothetical protein
MNYAYIVWLDECDPPAGRAAPQPATAAPDLEDTGLHASDGPVRVLTGVTPLEKAP